MFLLQSPSLCPPALSRPPPVPPNLPRAGCGCAVSRRPSPSPGPRAPLRPAPRAGSRPLHPGTDFSRPDFGTMVMAEGTAVLRRNRPGTKAQVLSLHLWWRGEGTLGAELRRTWKVDASARRLGRGDRRAGRGTGARPALPEPQPLGLAEAAAAREACGAPTGGWAWGARGGRQGPGLGACQQRLLVLASPLIPSDQLRGGARPAGWRPLGCHEGRGCQGGRGVNNSLPRPGFHFLPGLWRARLLPSSLFSRIRESIIYFILLFLLFAFDHFSP